MARHSQPQNIMTDGVTVLSALCGTPWSADFEDSVAARFPENVRSHVKQHQRPEDRALCYTARLLLLNALIDLMGLPNNCLERWTIDKNGRPFLEGLSIEFNISHAGDMAVCAISTRGRVGVDVEILRPLNPREFAFLFTENEMAKANTSQDPSTELLRLWTMKEAILKAEGNGFLKPSSELLNAISKNLWQLTRVDVGDNYCCHVAAIPHSPVTHVAKLPIKA